MKLRAAWEDMKVDVMLVALRAKFRIPRLLRLHELGRVRVSPYNSASHDATPHLDHRADVVTSINLCNQLGERWKAEVLVPQGVPLGAVYGVVFCDATARDEWWPAFQAALPRGSDVPSVRLASDGRMFRLPDDYRVDRRSRANGPGVDRLVGPAPPGWTVRLPAFDDEPDLEEPRWMDLDDWDAPEEDEGPPSWADFYDDGQPDDPEWYEPSLRD